MKTLIFSSLSMGLILFTVACAPGGNHAGKPKASAAKPSVTSSTAGVWIGKTDANDLRTTGQLGSVCEEIKAEPQDFMPNSVQIDASGNVFIRESIAPLKDEQRIGQLTANGFVKNEGFKKKEFIGQLTVKEQNGELLFNFGKVEGETEESINVLVPSTEEEMQKYFAAIEACKTEPAQTK